ncbi:hypothetical protein GCM10009712_44040 [Pseudarthrobacter sulfonivorans]
MRAMAQPLAQSGELESPVLVRFAEQPLVVAAAVEMPTIAAVSFRMA